MPAGGDVGAGEPLARRLARQREPRQGLTDQHAGNAVRIVGALSHAVQQCPECGPADGCEAERSKQEYAALHGGHDRPLPPAPSRKGRGSAEVPAPPPLAGGGWGEGAAITTPLAPAPQRNAVTERRRAGG